jgi:creatinine amidohydrolase
MKLIHLRPGQIKQLAEDGVPLLMAAGVVEYHGPHLPVGVDYLIASSVIEEVERRIPDACVLAPGLPFGPTGEWAGGTTDGEAHLGAIPLFNYVKPIFRSCLGMGFERILICQHHQGWTGPHQGALRLAAAELVQELGYEQGGGPGWGRLPLDQRPNVFGRIAVHGAAEFAAQDDGEKLKIAWGHAGFGETEYIRSIFPDTVDMDALADMKNKPRWLEESHTADGTQGRDWFERCVAGWIEFLQRNQTQ